MTTHEYFPSGEEHLKNIFSSQDSLLLVDLDDTVKESRSTKWEDGVERRFLPQTLQAFNAISERGTKIGVATEQSASEMLPFLAQIRALTKKPDENLFNGFLVYEGGAVVQTPDGTERNLVSAKSRQDLALVENILQHRIGREIPDHDGWTMLSGVSIEIPVKLPEGNRQGKSTLSLWEKGPHIGASPEYYEKYEKINEYVQEVLHIIGAKYLRSFEAGNGTIRIVPKNVSKHHSIGLLHAFKAIDLSRTVFACDGPNDIALARKIKSRGGGIIAVGNAIPEIKAEADYVATADAGAGFSEAIFQVLK